MPAFKSILGSHDISTRVKRRKAVEFIIAELKFIRKAEDDYLHRIPINLQDSDAYTAADICVETLDEAINILSDAF